jgi:intracellular sulfur oxidation DsrE/DsrF family protein
MTTKAVFHLNRDEEERLGMALSNIENLLKEVPAVQAAVHVVANGAAVGLFRRKRAGGYAARIGALAADGVRFSICNNSLNTLGIGREELLEPCGVVPAGILEIVRLQAEGCAYIKP